MLLRPVMFTYWPAARARPASSRVASANTGPAKSDYIMAEALAGGLPWISLAALGTTRSFCFPARPHQPFWGPLSAPRRAGCLHRAVTPTSLTETLLAGIDDQKSSSPLSKQSLILPTEQTALNPTVPYMSYIKPILFWNHKSHVYPCHTIVISPPSPRWEICNYTVLLKFDRKLTFYTTRVRPRRSSRLRGRPDYKGEGPSVGDGVWATRYKVKWG